MSDAGRALAATQETGEVLDENFAVPVVFYFAHWIKGQANVDLLEEPERLAQEFGAVEHAFYLALPKK